MSGVEVHVEFRDYRLQADVWFIQRRHDGSYVGSVNDQGRIEYLKMSEYEGLPPTLVLNERELAALAKAAGPHKGRDVSLEALDDARSVRDRLLTLVEGKLA